MILTLLTLALGVLPQQSGDSKPVSYPSFNYEIAEQHELPPHRRSIPHQGISEGFNQLHLKLIVSASGEMVEAHAEGEEKLLKLWPELQNEVKEWKFTPFEKDGKAAIAEVEEYLDLVPPERYPSKHVKAPVLRPDSRIKITLERSGCLGSCPSYKVEIRQEGITFEGGGYVVAHGVHTAKVNPTEVLSLAKRFVEANFYSMDNEYAANVTDCPSYTLSIDIDGSQKRLMDYMGTWIGMPAVIRDLEDSVDEHAKTKRWIDGDTGLVESLKEEKFNFKSYDAQVILKETSTRGETATVQELLEAGVSLLPIPAPKPKEDYMAIPFDHVGWLAAASTHPETLAVLMDKGASEKDQEDMDLALLSAARAGKLESVRELIDYGADPNADFRKSIITEEGSGMTLQHSGSETVLIAAAKSGRPEVIREILRYHPDVNARDREGKTALFVLGDGGGDHEEDDLIECVQLLVQAGADVNARDQEGNTPLHEIYYATVDEELIKLGANVNARNNDGETPIFTNVGNDVIALFVEHGADLNIRNKEDKTVFEANRYGQYRIDTLNKALESRNQKSKLPAAAAPAER